MNLVAMLFVAALVVTGYCETAAARRRPGVDDTSQIVGRRHAHVATERDRRSARRRGLERVHDH